MVGRLKSALDSDITHSFCSSPLTVAAAIVALAFVFVAMFADWLTVHTPFDSSSLDLLDSFLPPVWQSGGQAGHVLGTDDQGRDILAAIMYGTRISLLVGFFSVALSMLIGLPLGIASGYFGGWIDVIIMRIADVQLTIPPILIALMIDGVARTAMPSRLHETVAIPVLILSIGIASWPQYARVARGGTMVERKKDYIAAARIARSPTLGILAGHILPNVVGPTLVIATIGIAVAIIIEATLSFLGVGVPPTTPSLGTLIRIGNDFLFSGEWWITLFPSLALVLLVLSVNLIGDWLRDVFNPKLR